MAAARHGRGPREVVSADIGERGRRTGVAMPRQGEIRLTQDGFEDPDEFFKSPPPQAGPSTSTISKPIHSQLSPVRSSQPLQIPSSAGKRARPANRPDVTSDLGIVGRKTGAAIVSHRRMPLAANGFEDMDAFFAQKPASIPPIKRRKVLDADNNAGEDDYDNDVTANYGARGERPRKPSSLGKRPMRHDSDQDEEQGDRDSDEQAVNNTYTEGVDVEEQSESEEEEEEAQVEDSESEVQGNIPQNQPLEDDDDDVSEQEDDGGTRTMDLDGSSYFAKTSRSLADIAGPSMSSKSRRVSDTSNLAKSIARNTSDDFSSKQSTARRQNTTTGTPRLATRSRGSTSSDNDDIRSSLVKSTSRSAEKSRRSIERRSESPVQYRTTQPSRRLYRGASDEDSDDAVDAGRTAARQPPTRYEAEPPQELEFDPGDDYPDGPGVDDYGDEQGYDGQQNDDDGIDEDEGQADEPDSDDNDPLPPIQEAEDDFETEAGTPQLHPRPTKQRQKIGGRAEQDASSKPVLKPPAPSRKRKRHDVDHDGVRRSERDRTHPLEFWRGEHIKYRRRDSGINVYYEKVGVEGRPKPPVRSLVKKKSVGPNGRAGSVNANAQRGRSVRSQSTTAGAGNANGNGVDEDRKEQDWAQWDEETEPDGIVWDYVEGKEVRKRVAFTAAMLDPHPTKQHAYKFQRVFTDGDFLAGGILIIPPNESKPLKPAKDNSYILFCHQGAVRVLVHRTEFSIAKGGFFFIPRGNSYLITNLADVDAVLCFTQGREIVVEAGPAVDE